MKMIKLYKVVFLQGENTLAKGKFPLVICRSGLDKWELTWTLTSADPPLCTVHLVKGAVSLGMQCNLSAVISIVGTVSGTKC